MPVKGFWNSVRNSPPHVVSQRTTRELLDLSKLPCEITQNEIVHGGDNYMDFVSTWYERSGDLFRFFDLRGPLKMPEVGVTPGYGCPGRISPYEEDDELKALARKYRFRTGWFHRGFPKEGDKQYQLYQDRLRCWESKTNDVLSCYTCTVEKIPFLFSPAPGRGPMPLVVYIAGSGEQGTDLKKMFRQTGVFDAVRDPSFVFAQPCHLLAIMPPEFANRDSYIHYPHLYSHCSGEMDGVCPEQLLRYCRFTGSVDLIKMYADLVFELQRQLESKGRGTIDPNAIVLTGLGSGASAALSMMREYPGRYAGVCATYPSWQFLVPAVDRYRPGRWWFAVSEAYHKIDDKVNTMVEVYRKAGADVRLNYYPNGDNWWNAQYSSPEFQGWIADCCSKGPLHGEKLIIAQPGLGAKLLLAKTGPDEATYYGTVEERPEGLPSEVADKRIKDIKGIRYLYVDGSAREIPTEAFMRSPELETVHIKSYGLTNIAARAFAESPKLNLVVFEGSDSPRIAGDAFDGCAPALYGGTIGVPVEISWGVTKGTNTTIYGRKKISLKSHALPVDGLFSTHLFLCDDQIHRRLHITGDFLWSEEGEDGANALMFLGEGRDVFVPDKLGERPVVALGRHLLHRRWGEFEYGILAIPATVRSMPLFPGQHKVSKVFAACKLGFEVKFALSPETVVYGTTPDKTSGKLVPSWIGWEGKEVVVPRGTNPREFFSQDIASKFVHESGKGR
jgi:predicted esterase